MSTRERRPGRPLAARRRAAARGDRRGGNGLVRGEGGGPARQLLAGAIAVALRGWTGGLHLDGLADTADGLAPPPAGEALDMMRRSDVGPLGVATLVLVILVQMAAVAALPRGLPGAAGLVLAAVTGRASMLLATGTPAARPAGSARWSPDGPGWPGGCWPRPCCRRGGRGRAAAGRLARALRALAAALAGLAAGAALRRTARRRLRRDDRRRVRPVDELSTAAVLVALVCDGKRSIVPMIRPAGPADAGRPGSCSMTSTGNR